MHSGNQKTICTGELCSRHETLFQNMCICNTLLGKLEYIDIEIYRLVVISYIIYNLELWKHWEGLERITYLASGTAYIRRIRSRRNTCNLALPALRLNSPTFFGVSNFHFRRYLFRTFLE